MIRALRHWRALLSIFIQDGLAYKASAFIWVLTDASTAIVMPCVLIAAAQGGTIQGYSPQGFVLYYLTSLLVTSFCTCHFMWEVAMEVKEGQFSNYLLRPISFLQYMAARNLAWRFIRTIIFLPVYFLILWAFGANLAGASINLGPITWVSLLLSHLLSFMFVMAFSTVALFIQEATTVFELYYVPMLFLSGQLFPIALFPQWAQSLAHATPFYYTVGATNEIITGRIPPSQYGAILGTQCAWLIGSYLVYRVMFRLGLRQYSGVGM